MFSNLLQIYGKNDGLPICASIITSLGQCREGSGMGKEHDML